jgi:hypothetical protein
MVARGDGDLRTVRLDEVHFHPDAWIRTILLFAVAIHTTLPIVVSCGPTGRSGNFKFMSVPVMVTVTGNLQASVNMALWNVS